MKSIASSDKTTEKARRIGEVIFKAPIQQAFSLETIDDGNDVNEANEANEANTGK